MYAVIDTDRPVAQTSPSRRRDRGRPGRRVGPDRRSLVYPPESRPWP